MYLYIFIKQKFERCKLTSNVSLQTGEKGRWAISRVGWGIVSNFHKIGGVGLFASVGLCEENYSNIMIQ